LLRFSRLKKHAEWASIVPTTADGIQVLTNAMASGSDIQLNYKGSGWRDVLPYGWNSSKEGNILLMCYKDTGEIRSYRLDRINELWVHDVILNSEEEDSNFEDFEIPELEDMEDIIKNTELEEGQENPFDDALDTLNSDNDALINMYNDFEINPNDIEEGFEDLTEEDFNIEEQEQGEELNNLENYLNNGFDESYFDDDFLNENDNLEDDNFSEDNNLNEEQNEDFNENNLEEFDEENNEF